MAPQKDWEVNQPEALAKVLEKLDAIQKGFQWLAVREGLRGCVAKVKNLDRFDLALNLA